MLNENEILVIDFEAFDYNGLIVKELSVHSKNYQETLLFKPPQAFSTISTINRDSIIFLTKRIHGIDWDSGVYPYTSIHNYLASLRLRFPNAIVFVDGHVKRAFISNYFKKFTFCKGLVVPQLNIYVLILWFLVGTTQTFSHGIVNNNISGIAAN